MYKKLASYLDHRLAAFTIALITIFIAVSLATYSPHDPSWFYYTTQSGVVENQMGIVGSYVASALLYLLGGAAYQLVAFGVYLFWAVASRASLHDEWERGLMFGLLIGACTLLQCMYGIDLILEQSPGGIVGKILSAHLFALMDPIIVATLATVSIWISLILISRLAFISAVHYGLQATAYMLSFVSRMLMPIMQPIVYVLARMRERLNANVVYVGYAIKEKLYGTASTTSYQQPTSFSNFTTPSASQEPARSSYEPPVNSAHTFVHDADGSAYEQPSVNSAYAPTDNRVATSAAAKSHAIANAAAEEPDSFIANAQESQSFFAEYQEVSISAHHEPAPEPKPLKPYELPPNRLFAPPVATIHDQRSQDEVQARARILEEKLECFGITGSVVSIKCGPVVTLFEYEPAINIKISKIMSLEDDLALALQAMSIRIIAPVPGTPYVGFEVANKDRKSVSFAALARSEKFKAFNGRLPLILGENTIGNTEIVDLASMPHLLIAGSTGSGKSVALNTMLISLLCKRTPEQLRMILVDPKRLEFASYADLPHLLFPIITDPKKSAAALKWVVQTMEERYEQMAESGVRNIADYNTMRKANGQKELPFIVVVIDELADLMMTTGKEIEDLIVRIAQMARASGIHMILATQRPSVDVITGLIKVNFPSRISCRVTSKVDSRTILDSSGAEKLLGKGDMLFLNSNSAALQRVHGAYISDAEIEHIANHIRAQRPPSYIELSPALTSSSDMHDADDELYQEILIFLESVDEISISLLQRRFRIGYNRSARIIDILESQGYVSTSEGSKMRKVVR